MGSEDAGATTGPTPQQAELVARVEAMAELATPFAIRIMATFGLADAIEGGARTVTRLAAATGCHEPTLGAVVRHLVAIGLLTDDDGLGVTPAGATLRSGAPGGLDRRFDLDGALGRADLAFVRLHDAVRTGVVAFDAHFGGTYWDVLRADPGLVASFQRSMADHDDVVTGLLLDVVPPELGGTLVDVGGGAGGISCRLLAERPGLHGIVVDLPETEPAAAATIDAAGLADRVRFEPADIRQAVPGGAGTYLASMVLHDWPDDAALAILRACRRAAPAGADLLVVEFDPSALPPAAATTIDLSLTVFAGATQRDTDGHGALLVAAGWSTPEVVGRSDGLIALRAR